ncbi:MAG: hypothetical protein ISS02_00060 [Candidatus Portnoybacteria bacterium]|nr:hypothetical protein [Candidatus Portnoybacteria bacterium]
MNIIIYLLIFSSLAWLGVIVYKKIPVLANLSEEEITILSRKKSVFQRIKGIDYKHYWLNFIIFLEKFLRKIKIIFLKIENLLSKWISGLRNRSQIMTQKSKEWIKHNEAKRREDKKDITKETIIKVNREEMDSLPELDEDDLPIEELKKPIKEEQKWIDLIIENPENITAYKFLGILYWKQHNYSDAKASLEMAVKFGSKDKKVKDILEELKKMNIK